MENKRLTEKLKSGNYICGIIKGGFVDKLGQLEDILEKHNIPNIEYLERCIIDHDKYGEITEQLGCPLEVIIKAMTSKIYYDIASGTGTITRPLLWYDDDGMFVFDTLGDTDYIYLNDYKQTWWLKEDRSE